MPTETGSFTEQVRSLLNRPTEEVRAWERTVLAQNGPTGDKSLVICGAGNMGRNVTARLLALGLSPLALTDNNPKLWGQSVAGIPILSPTDAVARYKDEAHFIVCIWSPHSPESLLERKQQWLHLGCRHVSTFLPLFWKYAEIFLPAYSCNLPHLPFEQASQIEAVSALWQDPVSQREYLQQLAWRTQLDAPLAPPVSGMQYFPTDIVQLSKNEAFVDCGAYTGDTLHDFLQLVDNRFGSYLACEPDPKNFSILTQNIHALPKSIQSLVQAMPLAISDRPGQVTFNAEATGASCVTSQGNLQVKADSLDRILSEKKTTFIKMDIEGAEPGALRGALQTISQQRPTVTVCVYHLQEHLWEIPAYLHSQFTDYRYFLRSHCPDGFDLVCYAIPQEKVIPGL